MPLPQIHACAADKQRAYRERQKAGIAAQLQAKGLPGASPLPNAPNRKRWTALIEQARLMLETAQSEIQEYCDERSDTWQESDKAQELRDWLELIEQATGSVDEALGF